MSKKRIIGDLRATAFVSPIVYDPQNLKRITDLLDPEAGYMPNLVQQQVLPPGFPIAMINDGTQLEWEMVSNKNKTRIHFGPQKIDIIQTVQSDDDSIERKFCSNCLEILSSIVERFSLVPTRLAYAPTYTPIFDKEFTRTTFIESIYKAMEFGGSRMNTILFKQGYTITERIGNKDIILNYVVDASEGHKIEEKHQPDGSVHVNIQNILNLVLDINTRQGVGYSFTIEEMKAFFEQAPEYATKFYNYYVETH